ncbi:hypothetical protein GWK47_021925 [Chionoecetes opilio]|uniref:Uncharacterized protein n=1 Tax=Chionoecetes opilio TaxID=41210 RepID=A0A8J5CGH2_CHIOP|nr:hypothetical protein GWK47_021925 [Chionoecetes opilio]
MTFSSSFLRPKPTLMTAPLPSPATDVTGRTRCAASTWHWTTSSPGVVDGRSTWPLTKPRLYLSPAGKTSPTCQHRTYEIEGRSLPFQRSISILGVEFDAGLTFTSHARRVAKNSAWRLSCVQRISDLLDAKGVEVLYKSQVCPLMEYSPLTWASCPPSYLATLDRVQRRAQRLVNDKRPHHAPDYFQPLQKRRDVAGLCVMHKALNLHTPRLAAIKLPRPPPPLHSTRVVSHRQEQVTVPFSRTEHHLRSFLLRYGRLWNQLVHQTDLHHHASLQDFKRGVNS